MSEYQLSVAIVERSISKNWDKAKLEWQLLEIYLEDEPRTCLCTHFPIIEICVLTNKLNDNTAEVRNCCVKKFIGLPSDKIFQAVKRIRKDIARSLNAETIEHAYSKNWINDWERTFYFDVMRKRSLTDKQNAVKERINRRVLTKVTGRR